MTAASDLVAAQRERSRTQVARYHEIRAVLEKLRVSASSADRSVTVELAAGGAIVDLRLTQQAMAKTPETLSRTILEAIRLGLAEVAERTAAEVEPLTGRRIDVAAVATGRLPSLSGDDRPEAPRPTTPGHLPPDPAIANRVPADPKAAGPMTADRTPQVDPRFAAEED